MIARATLDKKYTALYNFPLYYLSSDRLRELRKKKANFKFLTLKVVMERCQSVSYPNIVEVSLPFN